jgi:hypothetical protein
LKKLLLLLTLVGCLRSSRDAAVLAPLGSQLENGFFDPGTQPLYLLFADPLTAGVFKNLKPGGRYRIAPKDARLVCPSSAAGGMQGYLLRVRVDKLWGDSALATNERMCGVSGQGQIISTGEHILLVRVQGKWKVDQVISGFTLVPR